MRRVDILTSCILDRIKGYTLAEEARRMGLCFYFREIVSDLDTEVRLKDGRKVLMLGRNWA